jgi:DNA-binding NarL/FixJ family response regulator
VKHAPIRVVLVDDHAVVRAGTRRLLEDDPRIEVVGEAGDAGNGYAAVVRTVPDVLVADYSLPDFSGLELMRRCMVRQPTLRTVMVSMHDSAAVVEAVLGAGASGFVTKENAPEVLLAAIFAAVEGRSFLSEDLQRHHPSDAQIKTALADLSPREMEIFRLLALGHTAAECGERLSLSPKTIANYQAVLKEKLGVATTAAMAHLALRHGLINPFAP